MFQLSAIPDPIRLMLEAATVGAAVWGILHQDRKERKKDFQLRDKEREQKAKEKEQLDNERHEENKESLTEIRTQLRYHPPHVHMERKGQPLMSDGIQYGPRRRPDDSGE